MDELDEKIVRLMQLDARQTSDMIAQKLNVSSATIRRRLKKLYDNNELIIEAYLDPVKHGAPVVALVGMNIVNEHWDEVMSRLIELPEIPWLSTTTGRFDAFALVNFNTNENLYVFLKDVLRRIRGIRDIEPFLILRPEKSHRLR